jgi:hypothetical protein
VKLIFTHRLAVLLCEQEFWREISEESIAVLAITMDTSTSKPLHKPMQLKCYQMIEVSSMAGKENSFMKGDSMADNCCTGNVRPCCAVAILFDILTIIRLSQLWL